MEDQSLLLPLLVLLITIQLGDHVSTRSQPLRPVSAWYPVRLFGPAVVVAVLSTIALALLAGRLSASLLVWMLGLALVHAVHTYLRIPLYGPAVSTTSLRLLATGYLIYSTYLAAFTLVIGPGLGSLIAGTIARADAGLGVSLSTWLPTAVATVAGFLFVGRSGAEIVRAALDSLHLPADSEQGQLSIGMMIGYLERYLLLTFILLGQYGAIGFVLAAKSIARYTGITESKAFAEYYLVGTLTSATVAIAAGLAVKGLAAALLPG